MNDPEISSQDFRNLSSSSELALLDEGDTVSVRSNRRSSNITCTSSQSLSSQTNGQISQADIKKKSSKPIAPSRSKSKAGTKTVDTNKIKGAPKQRKSTESTELQCNTCLKIVSALVGCDFCDSWNCRKCAKLPVPVFDEIGECSSVHWYCDSCKMKVEQVLGNAKQKPEVEMEKSKKNAGQHDDLQKLNMTLLSVERKVEQIQRCCNNWVDPAIGTSQSEDQRNATTKTSTEAVPLYSEEASSSPGHGSPNNVELLQEYADRERRSNNLIIHNVPESSSPDTNTRQKEDLITIQSIVSDVVQIEDTCIKVVKTVQARWKKTESVCETQTALSTG